MLELATMNNPVEVIDEAVATLMLRDASFTLLRQGEGSK